MIVIEGFKEVAYFLVGTFHQDAEEPEVALKETIDNSALEGLREITKELERFLASDLSEERKVEFIESNAEIYFPAINMQPIEWLVSVVEELKKHIS